MNVPTLPIPRDDAELASLLKLLEPIFNFPPGLSENYGRLVGRENFRFLPGDAEPAGALAVIPMAQWFGGRAVPMWGVAVVGVAPAHRSRGTAGRLMRSVVAEMHEKGVAISVLYPALLSLYRGAGYELAGSRYEIRLPLRNIGSRDRGLDVQPLGNEVPAAVRDLHARRAIPTNGHLERPAMIWERVRAPRGEKTQGFLFVNPGTGEAEGYTYFIQKDNQETPYTLAATDVVALTPAAAARMLSFFADFRSMAEAVTWFGSAADTMMTSMHDRGAKVRLFEHWMLRVTHVKASIEQRGYAPGLQSEIHFDVRDDLLPANAGRWTIHIADGRATAQCGGRGDIQIDIRGLAALYTGFSTPHELQLRGLLQVAGHVKDANHMLLAAGAAFAGPTPWMSEMF